MDDRITAGQRPQVDNFKKISSSPEPARQHAPTEPRKPSVSPLDTMTCRIAAQPVPRTDTSSGRAPGQRIKTAAIPLSPPASVTINMTPNPQTNTRNSRSPYDRSDIPWMLQQQSAPGYAGAHSRRGTGGYPAVTHPTKIATSRPELRAAEAAAPPEWHRESATRT